MRKLRPHFTFSNLFGAGARGQSLVETALFLPIMIIMLLGIVEVSTLLINQNRVTTAGRIAAGYGAANYRGDNWNELAPAMGIVALNTVTETLDLSPDLWDIWAVHAVINNGAFEQFQAVHIYGNQQIVSVSDWNTTVEARVRQELIQAGDDVELVAAIPYHDSATFLNLPIWQWAGFKTISGLTAMRADKPAPIAGCAVLPIAVRLNQSSAYPTNWPTGPNAPRHPADEGGEMFYFPGPSDFDNVPPAYRPWPPPTYINSSTAPYLETNFFKRNVPGVNFINARPGYVYLAREGTSSGGFGWLSWDGAQSQQALQASLAYNPPPPGNFMEKYPGSAADMGTLTVASGQTSGNGNGVLEEYEWVQVSTGNIQASSADVFVDYVYPGRPVTLLYYDEVYGTGSNAAVRARGFVTVKLLGIGTTGNPKWMLFEFIRWSTECLDIN